MTNIETSCLCFVLFGDVSCFRFPGKCRLGMDLHNRFLILFFPNVSAVVMIISTINSKSENKNIHSSKILDDKISQMHLVADCWEILVV